MQSIYFTIVVFAVLAFSSNLFGQHNLKNPEVKKPEKIQWTIVVTDKFAPKKSEIIENKTVNPNRKTTKVAAKNDVEKTFFQIKKDETTTTNSANKQTPKSEKTPEKKPAAAAKKLADWEKTWSILAKFSTSFDTNIEHDPVGLKAFGFVPSITAGYQLRSSRQRLRFIYSFAAPRYTQKTDLTRIGNYFGASYRYSAGKWSFETDGEVSLKGTSEDRETNDQYILTETIGYRFNKKTRLNVYGAYRIRRFPAADSDRNAVNPMLGMKFSRQINKKIDWNIAYRYDENRAVNPRQNYIRSTYKTGFDFQLNKSNLIETEISYRPRRYTNRPVKIGDAKVLRRDKKWSFNALWTHNFTPRRGFEAGYQFENQNSNDTSKMYRNHQIVFSIFYHWGNGDEITP